MEGKEMISKLAFFSSNCTENISSVKLWELLLEEEEECCIVYRSQKKRKKHLFSKKLLELKWFEVTVQYSVQYSTVQYSTVHWHCVVKYVNINTLHDIFVCYSIWQFGRKYLHYGLVPPTLKEISPQLPFFTFVLNVVCMRRGIS